MNTKELIITSVKDMDRKQWLEFRQPLTHVNELLQANKVNSYKKAEAFFETDTWKEYVFPCVGGSEIATVMGLNDYKAAITLFYEKVGVTPFEDFDKEIMFWGRELEGQVAEKWQYWEHESDNPIASMIENFKAGRIIRKMRKVNAYIQNRNFPFIFVSLDRIINQYSNRKEGALECKTISIWAAKQWEAGIPPMYIVQNQGQLHVCILEYGEIAILKDGREFDVLPFDYNANIGNAIQRKCEAFFLKVKKGIEHFVLSQLTSVETIKNMHLHEIDNLSPDADGSESYKNYLAVRYTDKGFSKMGGEMEFQIALKHEQCNEEIKKVNKEKTLAANQLKTIMAEASELSFGDRGKVTWVKKSKPKKDGTFSRTFKVILSKMKKTVS